jgi:hypothetical protein
MMTFQDAQRSQEAARPTTATFRTWCARARSGERIEYYRGYLATDRSKGTSSLTEAERRKLTAVADHALALSDQGNLHLLQERHGDRDYSYWAVVGTTARSASHVTFDQGSQPPRR